MSAFYHFLKRGDGSPVSKRTCENKRDKRTVPLSRAKYDGDEFVYGHAAFDFEYAWF